jgi:hypothetical protein
MMFFKKKDTAKEGTAHLLDGKVLVGIVTIPSPAPAVVESGGRFFITPKTANGITTYQITKPFQANPVLVPSPLLFPSKNVLI